MDKLRALQYFVASAGEGSFASAARRLQVSMPAVLKLINALERELGVSLFHRSSRGLELTAEGTRYLERCEPLLAKLDEASTSLAGWPRGAIVVGAAPFELHCLAPFLPPFHARYPDIEIHVRAVRRVNDPDTGDIDVFLGPAWQDAPDMVRKVVATTPYRVVATPAYWDRHGIPRDPEDLTRHECFIFRSGTTLLDVWKFSRGDESRSVTVAGWLTSGERDLLVEAALADTGVMRARELTARPYLRTGRLVAVLTDWSAREAPPVAVMFRPRHRRTARVRAFTDFVTESFGSLQLAGDPMALGLAPAWWGKGRPRASGMAARRARD